MGNKSQGFIAFMKKILQFNRTKICSLLPVVIILLSVILLPLGIFSEAEFLIAIAMFILVFGWLPALISSILGIVFSSLSPKEEKALDYFVISILTCIGRFFGEFLLSWCSGIYLQSKHLLLRRDFYSSSMIQSSNCSFSLE